MGKQFNTISDIINDEFFQSSLKENISKLKEDRAKRPNPKPGFYYKRDWFDRMWEGNMLNFDFFKKNIESIWNKKSDITSQIRNVIEDLCNKSVIDMLKIYKLDELTEVNKNKMH
jgi:hypothetical protein